MPNIQEAIVMQETLKKLYAGMSNEIKEMFDLAISALRFKSYFDSMYGQGLEIANWHMNGDLEPFDNFYEAACEDK